MRIYRYQGNVDRLMNILSNCWYGAQTEYGYGPGKLKDWDYCKKCEYCCDGEICISHLLVDIEDYLKDQKDEIESLKRQIKSIKQGFFAKLLTAEELMSYTKNEKRYFCYIEYKGNGLGRFDIIGQDITKLNSDGSIIDICFIMSDMECYSIKSYNKDFRCWTFEPTEYQAKNTQWEAELCE